MAGSKCCDGDGREVAIDSYYLMDMEFEMKNSGGRWWLYLKILNMLNFIEL